MEKQKQEVEEKQREARIKALKESYSSCRFLFDTDEKFVSCITQKNTNAIENEIKLLIDQKMNEISNVIVKGTEFKNQYYARINMEGICDIPDYMRSISPTIANYAENKIEDFVAARKNLNKAYNKAKRKDPDVKCSDFFIFNILYQYKK